MGSRAEIVAVTFNNDAPPPILSVGMSGVMVGFYGLMFIAMIVGSLRSR